VKKKQTRKQRVIKDNLFRWITKMTVTTAKASDYVIFKYNSYVTKKDFNKSARALRTYDFPFGWVLIPESMDVIVRKKEYKSRAKK